MVFSLTISAFKKGEIGKDVLLQLMLLLQQQSKKKKKYKQQKMYGVGSGVCKKREWTKTETREVDNKMLFNFSINRSMLAI